MLMAENKESSEHKPHKYFEDQFDDEEVLLVFRKHPIVMRKGLIIGLSMWLVGPLAVLALTYLNPTNPPSLTTFFLSLVASIGLGILVLVPFWISWYFSVFIITDQRFVQVTQKGLFTSSVVDIGLNQVQMLSYEIKGIQEALLAFGTIRVQTYMGELVIHDIHHPAKITKKLQLILRDLGINGANLA